MRQRDVRDGVPDVNTNIGTTPSRLRPSKSTVPTSIESARISFRSLLIAFLKIGSIGFGGGMAVISLMEREFVQKRKLLTADEFVHGIGLGQILGSFAVNASFFVGYRLFGPTGGVLSAVAFLMPSIALVTALSGIYFRYHSIPALQGAVAGLGPVVIALIVTAAWSLGRKVVRTPVAVALAAVALAAGILKVNAVWVLLAAGAAGLLLHGKSSKAPPRPKKAAPPRNAAMVTLPPVFAVSTVLGSVATTFFKIGLVFFGGGFVLLPVLHNRIVTGLHWLSAREFLDGVAISNLTPGPIAVLATFTGYHMGGIAGAMVATIALFTPGLVLMVLMCQQYEKYRDDPRAGRFLAGVNPAVTGLVLSAAALLRETAIVSWRGWVFCGMSILLLARWRWHPALLLGFGTLAGYFGVLP